MVSGVRRQKRRSLCCESKRKDCHGKPRDNPRDLKPENILLQGGQPVIARMLTEKPRPIRTTRSAVPEYVEETVQRALEKLPADRFSTVRAFADGLRGRIDFATGSSAITSARRSGVAPIRAL